MRNLLRGALGRMLLAVAVAMTSCGAVPLWAADPAFVGVLSLAVEPDVARELGVTDEVRGQLLALVDKREQEVLSQGLDKLTGDERAAKLAEFAAESENQGLALLSDEQKTKLAKLRIARQGMLGLADAKIAADLGLTRDQQQEIEKLVKEYNETMATGSDLLKKVARPSAEKRLAAVLTEEQRANWEKQSGAKAGVVAQTGGASGASSASGAPSSIGSRTGGPGGAAGGSRAAAGVHKGVPAEKGPNGEVLLRFNFSSAPWRDVLEWFAEQADLSFTSEQWPQGTFNYTDTRKYTQQQAMDVINRVLLIKGWVLVINDRMLMLFNVADGPVPGDWVPLLAQEELDKHGRSEFVKVVYKVSKMSPEAAEAEARKMIDPNRGNVVLFTLAKQIVVTETVEKQLLIRGMIAAVEDSKDERMDIIRLNNLMPIEFMAFARPLLQIPEGQNATSDGSLKIVADDLGGRIILTGKATMVERVRELVTQLDAGGGGDVLPGAAIEQPQLIIYTVKLADPATVLQVLQTLMAGNVDMRLTHDAKTGNIIALAKPSQHATIRATIDELEGVAGSIEVFKLRKADPAQMVLSINKLFGETPSSGRDRDRDQSASVNAPRVDADPINMMLYVRGTPSQIEAVRQFLIKIGESGGGANEAAIAASDRRNMRLLPLSPRDAAGVLEQVEALMGGRTKIRYISPGNSRGPGIQQGRFRPETPSLSDEEAAGLTPLNPGTPAPKAPARGNAAPSSTNSPSTKPAAKPSGETKTKARVRKPAAPIAFVNYQEPGEGAVQETPTQPAASAQPAEGNASAGQSGSTDNGAAPSSDVPSESSTETQSEIIVVSTPNGIMIRSDDLDALDQFEELVRIYMPATVGGKRYTVYYLKYAKAEIAASLVQEMLTGAPADSGGGGGLMGDLAAQMIGDIGGGMLGGLLGGGGGGGSAAGGALGATGAASIIPDPRLNALVISATPRDLDIIEQLLQVIDQPESPDPQQLLPPPRFIPVNNNTADSVATIVKQAYAGRIQGEGGQSQRQPSPQDFIEALRGGGRGRGGSSRQSRGEEAKMTIAVDTKSNSLIVSAPDYLFNEVKQLVEELDAVAISPDDTVRVVALKRTSATVMQQQLGSRLGTNATIKVAGAATSPSTTSRTSTTPGSTSQPGSTSGQPQFNPEDAQRRAEFFNALRGGGDRGGFGGGGPTFFGGFGSGGPGGFSGRSGFGGFGGGGPSGFSGFGGGDRGGSSRGGFSGFGGGDRGGGDRGGDRGGGDRGRGR